MSYNQNGSSRGVANINFVRADAAAKAAKDLNGMLVDKRPMKASVTLSRTVGQLLTYSDRSSG